MSQIGMKPEDRRDLLKKIGYDLDLEERSFRSLSELDVGECRSGFGRLVERLDLVGSAIDSRFVVFLLFDLLQRVNLRVNRMGTGVDSYQSLRLEMASRFAALETAEEARAAFMPLLNRILAPLTSRASTSSGLIDRAKGYIEENYHRRISLSMVAAKLNVSPNYLSRVFRRETGSTLTTYIQKARLDRAMILLAEGSRSISEIAYLVGYQNYRDFYRNFVKYENASPRQVQRRLIQ